MTLRQVPRLIHIQAAVRRDVIISGLSSSATSGTGSSLSDSILAPGATPISCASCSSTTTTWALHQAQAISRTCKA